MFPTINYLKLFYYMRIKAGNEMKLKKWHKKPKRLVLGF